MDHLWGDVKTGSTAQALTWDAVIGRKDNSVDGGTVRCFAADSTDLYIAGDFRAFDTITTEFLVHYNKTTGVWESLDEGPHNTVFSLALHDHKLFVGGAFTYVGSAETEANNIAVWDGSWHTMAGGMNDDVNALAFVGDTLYAGGRFTKAGTTTAYGLAFWDGFGWQEAAGGTSYPVESLFSTGDSLFVGGSFTYVGSETSVGLTADGIAMLRNGEWTTFGDGFEGTVLSMLVYHGTLLAGGDFYRSRNLNDLYYSVAQWDGTTWHAFGHDTAVGSSATGEVTKLLNVHDTVYAFGNFSSMAGAQARNLARMINGVWSEAGGGVYGATQAGILFDGRFWIGGRFTKGGSNPINSIGVLDGNSWSGSGKSVYYLTGIGPHNGWESDRVAAIVTSPQYVFIGGTFTTVAGKTCNHIAAWDRTAKKWTELGEGVNGNVYALTLDGNTLYVGGDFSYAGNIPARRIAKYDLISSAWSAMGEGSMRDIGTIAIDENHSVYASVFYTPEGSDYSNYLGKWSGNTWSVFGGPFIGYAEGLAWSGSSLYMGGEIYSADGGIVNNIAQFSEGSWSGLAGGADDAVYTLCVIGTDLYVGGAFTFVDGQLDFGVSRWDGSEWDVMQTGVSNNVYALTRSNKGVYIGGYFSSAGDVGSSITVNNLTEWTGTAYKTVSGGTDNSINALATDETALYVGGWIEHVGTSNTSSWHIAALKGAGAGIDDEEKNITSLSIFPNPISTSSTITLSLDEPATIRLELFNALGERVAVIVDKRLTEGPQEFKLDPGALPNGLYFLRLTAKGVVSAQAVQIDR